MAAARLELPGPPQGALESCSRPRAWRRGPPPAPRLFPSLSRAPNIPPCAVGPPQPCEAGLPSSVPVTDEDTEADGFSPPRPPLPPPPGGCQHPLPRLASPPAALVICIPSELWPAFTGALPGRHPHLRHGSGLLGAAPTFGAAGGPHGAGSWVVSPQAAPTALGGREPGGGSGQARAGSPAHRHPPCPPQWVH